MGVKGGGSIARVYESHCGFQCGLQIKKIDKSIFPAVKTHNLKFQTHVATARMWVCRFVGFSYYLILMKQATILAASLILSYLVVFYFKGGE